MRPAQLFDVQGDPLFVGVYADGDGGARGRPVAAFGTELSGKRAGLLVRRLEERVVGDVVEGHAEGLVGVALGVDAEGGQFHLVREHEAGEQADAELADRHQGAFAGGGVAVHFGSELRGGVVGPAYAEEVVVDDVAVHAGAVVVDADPLVALVVVPVGYGDVPALGYRVQFLEFCAGAGGVDGVLQQLPEENAGIAVEVLAHEQVQDGLAVEFEAEVAEDVALAYYAASVDFAR
jgi:hypothetical protein